jgi:Ca-activated chloride channel family protein
MITPVLFIALVLPAAPAQELLQNAQTHLLAQEWEEAADILDALALEEAPAPEVLYDRGIAHYNLEEYAIAAKAFEDAMAASKEKPLATYSAFNYGNAIFQQTMQDLEGTGTEFSSDEAIDAMEKAKAQIEQSLQSYRRAIAQDSADLDARANGEFAWQMVQQLDQMQEQMEEQQKQQQEQKDQEQQQDEESAQDQEKDQQNQEQGDSEQEQDAKGEQSEDQQQDGKQGEDSQEQKGEQSNQEPQEGEQSEQQSGENSEEEAQQKDGEQSKPQEQPKEQSEQQSGEETEPKPESQQNESSNEQESNEQDDQNTTEGELESTQEPTGESEVPQASKKEDGKRLSKDEAARLLQLIRDKEQQRRKALAARRAARRVPVEKDW